MVKILGLKTQNAENRVGVPALQEALNTNGLGGALILPTAGVNEVGKINDLFFQKKEKSLLLYTAGTLHPDYPKNREELEKFKSRKIKAIKLCSFSQKFALNAPTTQTLFDLIQKFNLSEDAGFFVIFDTLYGADKFFGSHPDHNTTPALLADLVGSFPQVNFVAAHMGGLAAPFSQIRDNLIPRDNFFLDTSNAAHIMAKEEYISLLKIHGPEHIIFGTDWPWFTHTPEIDLQNHLLQKAGYSQTDMERVFSGNITRLLGASL